MFNTIDHAKPQAHRLIFPFGEGFSHQLQQFSTVQSSERDVLGVAVVTRQVVAERGVEIGAAGLVQGRYNGRGSRPSIRITHDPLGHFDRAIRAGDGSGNGLTNPIGRVGAEAKTEGRIKSLRGAEQAALAFKEKIVKGQPFCVVSGGNTGHQAGVLLDESGLGPCGGEGERVLHWIGDCVGCSRGDVNTKQVLIAMRE